MTKGFLTLIIFVMISVSLSTGLNGQSISLPKSIIIEKNDLLGMHTKYIVKPKNTLYSICKTFKVKTPQLQKANPQLDLFQLNPGDSLLIPVNGQIIDDFETINSDKAIPVYYKTAKKDNLFRIARIYFDQNIELLMKRNHLSTHDLTPGQLILLGWKSKNNLEIPSTKNELKNTETSVTESKNQGRAVFVKKIEISPSLDPAKKDSVEIKSEVREIIHQKGLAIWNKKSRSTGIFALHNEAISGSYIEVFNPQLGRKEVIKVIGNIPGNSYPENVKIILSPDAAKALGALDSRFYVKMKFEKGLSEN